MFAQVIWTEPEYATQNDSIVVYFDATQAERTDLVVYSGDVYTYTCVNTNMGEWQHEVASWGTNLAKLKLTNIYSKVYQLVSYRIPA